MRVFDEATLKKKRVQNENLKSANKIFSTNNNLRPNDIYTWLGCKCLFSMANDTRQFLPFLTSVIFRPITVKCHSEALFLFYRPGDMN